MQDIKNTESSESNKNTKNRQETRRSTRNHIFNLIFQFNFLDKSSVLDKDYIQCLIDDYYNILEYEEEFEIKQNEKFKAFAINKSLIENQVFGIFEKLSELDEKIKLNSEGWSIERIDKVDLAILRLSSYEILFEEDVPDIVAINEAVELSKEYSSEKSYKFVNAVLAKIKTL